MKTVGFEQLTAEVAAVTRTADVGRIVEIHRGTIEVSGLSHVAAQSDLVEIGAPTQMRLGEVLNLSSDRVTVLPDGDVEGLRIGEKVVLRGATQLAPDDSWIGRVLDPFGKAIDGLPVMRGSTERALRGTSINPTQRRVLGARLETGLSVFNTLLPIVRGQRIGLFAGSGVGKSTLLAKLARGVQAEVVVIALIGERGREVREFVERVLGEEGMKRSVVIAATSDQSPLVRRRAGWAAMTVQNTSKNRGVMCCFLQTA